jgi:hypothetical protein
MPRITVTLSDAAKEWVEAEAEARECSQSDVLAALVDEARGADTDPTVTDRLDALEERVSELEDQRTEAVQPDADIDAELNQPGADSRTGAVQADAETDAALNQPDAAMRDLVEELDIPGRGYETRQERAEVAVEYLTWVRDRGEVARSDVIHEFVTEGLLERAGYSSKENYWEKMGRDLLQDAAEHGVAEVDGQTYRWTGP